jgi:hypothetical protein
MLMQHKPMTVDAAMGTSSNCKCQTTMCKYQQQQTARINSSTTGSQACRRVLCPNHVKLVIAYALAVQKEHVVLACLSCRRSLSANVQQRTRPISNNAPTNIQQRTTNIQQRTSPMSQTKQPLASERTKQPLASE